MPLPCLSYRALAVASSLLYASGSLLVLLEFPLVVVLDANDSEKKRDAEIVWAMVGWAMAAVSVLPEILIDVLGKRQSSPVTYHSRYGRSDAHPVFNWLQTALFAGGSVCHGMSTKRRWDDDKSIFARDWLDLFSACLFTASGTLAIFVGGCSCCTCGCRRRGGRNELSGDFAPTAVVEVGNVDAQESDGVVENRAGRSFLYTLSSANSIFFGFSVAMIVAAAAGMWGSEYLSGIVFMITFTSYAAFFASGVMWLLSDSGCCHDFVCCISCT